MGFGGSGGSNSTIAGAADAALNNPQNSEVLSYNTGTAKWTNQVSPASSNLLLIHGAGSTRVHPTSGGAIPAGTSVLWVAKTRPSAMANGDIWMEESDSDLVVVGTSVFEPTTTTNTATIPVPGGVQNGDMILVFLAHASGSSTTILSGISGLTEYSSSIQSGHTAAIWKKSVASSSDSNVTITATTNPTALRVSLAVVVLRGATNIRAESHFYNNGSSSLTSGSLTTTGQAFELQFLAWTGETPATLSEPVGHGVVVDALATGDGAARSGLIISTPSYTVRASGTQLGGDPFSTSAGGRTVWTLELEAGS